MVEQAGGPPQLEKRNLGSDAVREALEKAIATRKELPENKDTTPTRTVRVFLHPGEVPEDLSHIRGDIGNYLREKGGPERERIRREEARKSAEAYREETGLPSEVEIIHQYYADQKSVELAMVAFVNQNILDHPNTDIEILKRNTLLLKKNGRPISLHQFFASNLTSGTAYFI